MIESLGLPPLPLPAGWLAPGETTLVLLPVGFLLLFFGRRLFWLLVALVGALAALWLATEMLGLEAGAPSLVAAIAAGLAGGLLAVLVQKAAIGVVGFLAGLWGTLTLLGAIARSGVPAPIPEAAAVWIEPNVTQLVLALAGGVLGAVLAARLFAAALVVLSALAGSLLLVHGLGLDDPLALAAFLGLALLGVLAQTRGGRRRGKPEPEDD